LYFSSEKSGLYFYIKPPFNQNFDECLSFDKHSQGYKRGINRGIKMWELIKKIFCIHKYVGYWNISGIGGGEVYMYCEKCGHPKRIIYRHNVVH